MRTTILQRVAMAAAIVALPVAGWAATVTVNAGGGGTYTTIEEAVGAFGSWSDANNDTIELAGTANHLIANNVNLSVAALTIKNAVGASPVIEITTTADRAFSAHSTGTFVLEGLTFIGTMGIPRSEFGIRSDPVPGAVVDVTVRDCVFTANNGSGAPRLDYTGSRPLTGTLNRGININSGGGQHLYTIENCVFAFGFDGGGISVGGGDGQPAAGSRVTVRNSLFAQNSQMGFRLNYNQPDSVVEFYDCAVIDSTHNAFYLGPDPNSYNLIFEDCIFRTNTAAEHMVRAGGFSGTFTNRRCTYYQAGQGQKMISFYPLTAPVGSFTLLDTIVAGPGPHDPAFSFWDTEGNDLIPAANAVSVQNVAIYNRSGAAGSADPTVVAAFAGAYGGNGPITADPLFATTDRAQNSGQIDGTRGWDSATNSLFDVTAPEYAGQSSTGGLLRGGARLVAGDDDDDDFTPAPLELIEHFNADAEHVIYNSDATAIELLFVPVSEPSFAAAQGWGGFYPASSGRRVRVVSDAGSTTWLGDIAGGNAFHMQWTDNAASIGAYTYTTLEQTIDMTPAESLIEFDANINVDPPSPQLAVRVLLRTEADGWIVSESVTGTVGSRNVWTAEAGTPPYQIDPNAVTWSAVTNATTTPSPDLDGTDGGFADDAGGLTIGAAVTPDLSLVGGFGIMINSDLSALNDTNIDGIRLTGQTTPGTEPNRVPNWTFLD